MAIQQIVTGQARVPQTRRLQPSVTVDVESVIVSTADQTEQVTRRQFTRPRESMLTAFKSNGGKPSGCRGCGK